jgi:hypothetical protein
MASELFDLQFGCAKVYQECVVKVSRCEIAQYLGDMATIQIASRLEFDQKLAFNDQICSVFSKCGVVFVKNSDWLLKLDVEALFS